MKILAVAAAFVLASLTASPLLAGDFVTKSYEFKPNRVLEVGLELPGGVRFDTIEFKVGGRDKPRAIVTVSNFSKESTKIGIAIAVVNADGHLLAAASGGTKAFPLRTERKMDYSISFDDVVSHFGDAVAFRIAIETNP